MTIQQAAALLNVSTEHVVGLVCAGDIDESQVSKFAETEKQRRRKILRELTEEAQRLGIDY
jgi:hypothetical protein